IGGAVGVILVVYEASRHEHVIVLKEVTMQSRVGEGILAGSVAGLVFGLMMQMMSAPTTEGGQVTMMAMVAKVVGSTSLGVGWIYHLFNSAVIGGIFGWLFGTRAVTAGSGLGWGAVYGIGWWILGGQI